MAYLGKGILGTPNGKIGNIMGYTRNGKGIIQRTPTVTDAYQRFWPLLKPLIDKYCASCWEGFNSTTKNYWAALAPSGMSAEEYFTYYWEQYYYTRKLTKLSLFNTSQGYPGWQAVAFAGGSYTDNLLHFRFQPNDPFVTGAGTAYIQIRGYGANQTLLTSPAYNVNTKRTDFKVPIQPSYVSGVKFFQSFIYQSGPFVAYGGGIIYPYDSPITGY